MTDNIKSPDEILANARFAIASMHNRPGMYIGSTCRTSAGEMFNGMMWMACYFWAMVQSRSDEFVNVAREVSKKHRCGSQGLAEGYRDANPKCTEEQVFQFVQKCWAEIAAELGIDISREAARPIPRE